MLMRPTEPNSELLCPWPRWSRRSVRRLGSRRSGLERRHVSDWDPSTEFNENGSPGVKWVQLAEAWGCPWPEAFDELKRLLVAAL